MGSKELYIFLLPESWRLRERGAVYNCPQTYLNIYILNKVKEIITCIEKKEKNTT